MFLFLVSLMKYMLRKCNVFINVFMRVNVRNICICFGFRMGLLVIGCFL